jgi:YD repeat-containing protein
VSYTYNADGTLASKTDANGNTETYAYDAYQRLTAIPARHQTFTYDTCPVGATGCANAARQLMQATFGDSSSALGPNDLAFEYNYSYTPAGSVSSKTLEAQSYNHLNENEGYAYGALTATYVYDSQGALTSLTYPAYAAWPNGAAGTVFNYTLDAMERPISMTAGNYTWASGVSYNAANQPLYCTTAPPRALTTACCK